VLVLRIACEHLANEAAALEVLSNLVEVDALGRSHLAILVSAAVS